MAPNYDAFSVSSAAHMCTMNQGTITLAKETAMNINHEEMEQTVTMLNF